MISVNKITFAYEKTPVLTDVSIDINTGDWLGLLGPNGSGKTTLIKCLSRNLSPQAGNIDLDNKDISTYSHQQLAQTIAIVPQDSNIPFPFSALEVVLMGRMPYHKNFGFENSYDLNISEESMKLTDTWRLRGRPFNELSGGERQRIIIARALAQEPKILLLDEPTTFLDIRHQQETLKLLKKLNDAGLTIISAMHDINLALLYCKNIAFLKDGRIINTGPTNKAVTYANLKAVFDTEVYVGINDLTGRPYYLPY